MPKWTDDGETSVGNVYLKGLAQPDFFLGLYKNNSEPAETDVMTNITEAQTPGSNGYNRIALDDADWVEQATKGVFKNVEKTFTANGAAWGDVYGYFITTSATGTSGLLVAVEHFSDGPYTVNDGWSMKVTPQITIT